MALSLKSISRNQTKPPRITMHGGPGIGKTTFAASLPSPVFIQTEDGLGHLDVPAFPLAQSYDAVIEAIGALYAEDHDFGTLVIDSLDWLEPLIWDKVCKDHSIPSIEHLGYGKGYVEALGYWRQVLAGVTALRDEKNMIVCMIAHSQVVRIEDPTQPGYDSFSLKLHKRASALVDEFSDIILYACLRTMVKTEDTKFNAKRARAVTTGDRIMHAVGQPAYTAKNRYGLPATLPLSWDALTDALTGTPTPTAVNQ